MINGSYIGEVDIVLRRRRKFTVQAGDDCELFYISRYEFFNIIQKQFPMIAEHLV